MELNSRVTWPGMTDPPMRRFGRGRLLFRADDPATSVYLIRRGHVRTYSLDEEGLETTTAILGARQIVGVCPLLGHDTYHAFAEALDDVEVWAWPTDHLLHSLLVDRDLLGLVVGSLAQRLSQEVELLGDVALRTVSERVDDFNRRQLVLENPPELTQRALADLIGIRPETLCRTLQRRRRAAVSTPAALPRHTEDRDESALPFAGTRPTSYRRGQRIAPPRADAMSLYQVRSGVVRLFLEDRTRQVGVDLVRSDEYFGLVNAPGPAGGVIAQAMTDVSIAPVSRNHFLQLLDSDRQRAHDLLMQIARRLDRVEQRLRSAHATSAHTRLAGLLDELGDRFGEPQADGCTLLPVGWTHAALGQEIGLRRETVTRALRTLAREGRVHQQGRRLAVRSPALP